MALLRHEMAEELKELLKNPPPAPPPPPSESDVKVDTSWFFKQELDKQREEGTLGALLLTLELP